MFGAVYGDVAGVDAPGGAGAAGADAAGAAGAAGDFAFASEDVPLEAPLEAPLEDARCQLVLVPPNTLPYELCLRRRDKSAAG